MEILSIKQLPPNPSHILLCPRLTQAITICTKHIGIVGYAEFSLANSVD